MWYFLLEGRETDEKPFPFLAFVIILSFSLVKKNKQIVRQLRGRKTKMAPNNPAHGL